MWFARFYGIQELTFIFIIVMINNYNVAIFLVYRIFTHTFFHKGPWHLAVTMIPMLFLGTFIERHIGSILFFLFIIICWIISTTLEVAMATMLYHIFHNLFHGCSLGFSGIVFGLTVLFSKAVKFKNCGISLFQVPLSLIPWLCICLYYFGFHRGSLFLHLGGIITGYACILFKVFNWYNSYQFWSFFFCRFKDQAGNSDLLSPPSCPLIFFTIVPF